MVGIVNFTDLYLQIDAVAHMVFFDRAPAEKLPVCKAIMQWMFTTFPLRRITVPVPAIYYATQRLVRKMGFVEEGRKRQAVLLGGRWVDQVIFGITREEVA